MVRIEIRLSDEVAAEIQKKAEADNRSRKSYIEWLCIKDVQTKKSKLYGNTEG